MMIIQNRPHVPISSPKPAQPLATTCEQKEASQSTDFSLYDMASGSVSVMAGLTQGLTRIIVGGCAGAAQGIVHGADLKEDQARMAFKVAMGANLAATGALAGGVTGLDFLALSPSQGAMAGAATNVMVGQAQWDASPGSFQDKVRQTSDAWLESTLQHFPESFASDPGLLARVTRSTLGNFVGMAAGTYAGVTSIGSNYREGHARGDRAFKQAADFFAPPPTPEG
ncbi:hypothetical protein JST97_06410 [bacterium]|nr:hypothetical protein [bacterium]